MQPEFFPIEEIQNQEVIDRAAAAKRLVGMLSEMRRKAAEFDTQRVFLEDITKWLEQTRAKGKATPTQIEGLILYAIEKQCAYSLTEIAEELKLDRKFVKEKLLEMNQAGLIRVVPRYVPGMFKPTYLFKSTRIDVGEAGQIK